jgi:hypothetical protein
MPRKQTPIPPLQDNIRRGTDGSISAKPDRYGLSLSLWALCVALVVMMIWFILESSFAKCSVPVTEPDRMSGLPEA